MVPFGVVVEADPNQLSYLMLNGWCIPCVSIGENNPVFQSWNVELNLIERTACKMLLLGKLLIVRSHGLLPIPKTQTI